MLTDEQWGHIAAEVVAKVGLARHGDPLAVRRLVREVATVAVDENDFFTRLAHARIQARSGSGRRRFVVAGS